ncbi:type II toxin-antitoxin system RelE/ParE family toxin [Teredinibacter waterburyi]|uniref:type II toxin-antitoxin system RelE/ParE family toxin n=1 Tax=Teredinibacter waterburyi TaxID=1500538 RepID=UPI00165FFBE8|nr:type II toxin-antitoxin system RelE/ParE family toxin [Teredinibacter waterburyi]
MKVTYTARAGRDFIRLRDIIRKKNPQAAQKASRQLKKNIDALVSQPQMGTPVEELEDFRELVARDYIVRYRVLSDEIVILNIWHGKEDR